jgi:hypothetical protein
MVVASTISTQQATKTAISKPQVVAVKKRSFHEQHSDQRRNAHRASHCSYRELPLCASGAAGSRVASMPMRARRGTVDS